MNGIDVSHWNKYQGKVKTAFDKADFCIIKATEGKSYVDPAMDNWIDRCVDQDKPFGFYHFANATRNMPDVEAAHFVEAVLPYIGEAVLVLDYEAESLQKGAIWALAFLEQVYKKTGVKPLLYVQESWVSKMKIVQEKDYGLWVAKWVSDVKSKKPKTSPWKTYAMWQYAENPVDSNIFNGNREQFMKYAAVAKNGIHS